MGAREPIAFSQPLRGMGKHMGRIRQALLLCMGSFVLMTLAAAGPSSARTETSGAPYCGPAIAKPGGGQWSCTFSDHFSGPSLASDKWTLVTSDTTGTGGVDCRVASPKTIRVGGGTLKLTVYDTGSPFMCTSARGSYMTRYAAGAVSTAGKFRQAFGRYEVRAAMPDVTVAGLHSSIWMWPQERRYGALSGEIDINERRTNIADRAVPAVHYSDDGTAGPKTVWDCRITHPERFHSYVLEWSQTTLSFIYDGQVCFTHEWQPEGLSKPKPFDEPYFLVLSQNLGGGYNAFDPAVTPLPATMVVDYVRIWS